MRSLLSGDEAVARGAWEAGCRVAAAYPGTPSTEILEAVAQYKKDIYCEWSTNEKVALEVCLGASLAGARALYVSKHVGVNVAADPLFSAAYIGTRGGLVIVTADDPGLHSSQNEQDNRFYGVSAKVPVLCPSDSSECKEFTKLAFEISEEFGIPVIVRLTTRTAHAKGIVTLGERKEIEIKRYVKDVKKTLILPTFAKLRHYSLEERLEKLKDYSNKTPINREEEGKEEFGIIADGVAYYYAKEAFPSAWFLKLGMVYPFPDERVRRFASKVKKLYVVEEVDPFIEMQVKALGIDVIGKERIPKVDELSPEKVYYAITQEKKDALQIPEIPKRPPVLCPGCGYRTVFHILSKLKVIVSGDIGCYTLGGLPPLNAMDTCVDMGASITVGHGIEKVLKNTDDNRKVVAIIGDSTFFHSGITGLIDVVYNKGKTTVIILDNRITAMTGHQDHPGTGKTLMGEETKEIKIEEICRAAGVEHVETVDPYDYNSTKKAIKKAIESNEPSCIIVKRPCALYVRFSRPPYAVDEDKCIGCKICVDLGCPAISFDTEKKKASINEILCPGCSICAQVCPTEAIYEKKHN